MVIVTADFRRVAEGREACVESYRDFLRQARIRDYAESDHAVDVFRDTAIATYRYDIAYEMEGQSLREAGHDLFVFAREGGAWLAAWRTLVPVPVKP